MSTPFDLKRTSQTARERIFAKLNASQRAPMPEPDTAAYYAQATPKWSNEIDRLKHWARTMRRFKRRFIGSMQTIGQKPCVRWCATSRLATSYCR